MKTKNKTKLILWFLLGLTYFSFFGMVIVNIPFSLLGIIITNDTNFILPPIVAEFTMAIYRALEAIIFIILIRKITFKEAMSEKLNSKAWLGILLAFSYSSIYYLLMKPEQYDFVATHFIRTLLIAPIFEELMFRGAIQRTIRSYSNTKCAIISTTIIFALYHFEPKQSLFVLPASLLFGYLAEKYSLKHAILAHIACNSVSLIYYSFPKIVTLSGLCGFVIITIALIIEHKNIIEIFSQQTEKEIYKKIFFNVPMMLILLTFMFVFIGS